MVMRRRRAWGDTRFAGAAIGASATVASNLLIGLPGTTTQTVTRIIGDITFFGIVTDTEVDALNVVEVGIGVVSNEAFALETLPDPGAVGDYPQQGWLYVATQPVIQVVHANGLFRTDARFVFDIRAQRKVDRGILFMLFENVAITGAKSLTMVGRVRALCLT